MPRRSVLTQVPEDIRNELNERLLRSGFADYAGHFDWLADRLAEAGLEISVSKTAIWRHGNAFEERLQALKVATEQAQAIAAASPDEQNAMNEALVRLLQKRAFDALTDEEDENFDLSKVGTMIARLSSASIKQKQWQLEAIRKAKLEAAQEAAQTAEKAAAKAGVSSEGIAAIRAAIVGQIAA